MTFRTSFRWQSVVFVLVTVLIVVLSALITNRLVERLSQEERKRMELWAEATERLISADEDTDIEFISTIIEQNTTIPVIMVDANGNYLLSRNVKEPKHRVGEFYQKKIATLRATRQPIEVRMPDDVVQYIYYEDSTLLRQLHFFPYVQFGVIFAFLLVCIYALYVMQRSEQNRVWVGLSKETAHQLGTPISSLIGWKELLQMNYPQDELIPEMGKDITRLQTIAERFSKVGSEPELQPTVLQPVLQESIDYLKTRTSDKVHFTLHCASDIEVLMNKPLFEWVIENLIKNAVDAMEGVGSITITVAQTDKRVNIDVEDTGKGIALRQKDKVFRPGYTTKKRGWGLGLSLARRIVEQYHRGAIYVLRSEVGKGTTFRIQLRNKI